jgi:hypothetical protein
MKTFYVLFLSMIVALPLVGFSGAAVAQEGRWVTGTTASGESRQGENTFSTWLKVSP